METSPRHRRSAFTLIELLVVIAIIALLVSILVPAVQRARDLAKVTVCTSHMKTIATGLNLYAEDNNGFLPPLAMNGVWRGRPSGGGYDGAWYWYIRGQLGIYRGNNSGDFIGWAPVKSYAPQVDSAYICPFIKPNSNVAFTTAYGLNYYMASTQYDPGSCATYSMPKTTQDSTLVSTTLFNIQKTIKPSEMYLVGESTGSGFQLYSTVTPNVQGSAFRHPNTGTKVDPRDLRMGLLYADGHLVSAVLGDLYRGEYSLTLPWRNGKNFTTTARDSWSNWP